MNRPLSIVLDTNILVSALWTKGGTAAKIVNVALMSDIGIYYSKEILLEYVKVLYRGKFKGKFTVSEAKRLLSRIYKCGILAAPSLSTIPLPDESDRIFYDLAKSTDSILITGNSKHYPPKDFIMSPTDFLKSFTCKN